MATILIADDDAAIREALAEAVCDLGHTALEVDSGEAVLSVIEHQTVNAVLLDLRMPGMEGLEVLQRLHGLPSPPAVTILTAYATASNTIEAMRLGAFDHLTKPIGRADLAQVLNSMLASTAKLEANPIPFTAEEVLVGSSEAMRQIQKRIGMLADSDVTVLITGETGTGKELVAHAIHNFGQRHRKPFIAVNCAAIPSDLQESEMFGHTRGAFTGAITERTGAFLQADGGTLFLDEIGDMDIAMQAKILRVLQERIVTPVGGQPTPVDVRVIAATHRDLFHQVQKGMFREDLFYRLHVVPIHLPPLRERITDIIPLAEYYLARTNNKQLAADAIARLIQHDWPGNIRELKNAMERISILVQGQLIQATDFRFLAERQLNPRQTLNWPNEDLPAAVAKLEATLIRRALQKTNGNRAEAARLLNIHRQLLYAKIKRYGIKESEDRTNDVIKQDNNIP
ncbi:response regulator containing CheY-like receiver AAA-type ATPase [Candidatus Nitrosoglobus terrae]|uniref:DNA-binding transcriptional regulator NtrC n=1 Tax=Candidatus Nitrosoglobus terrae TaxID=1630141 RepID=A0A1Q2SPN9_9GAMM|nr:sigma-54 dependent transcriptional regulator [Candidatus Nitrosoglobus terrae]BAW81104.1 response regulator containing CheY-like receiver AAA-type ATPase [Candidatus Nitrosoglobus terrae]